jgi:hypothetical protein
MLFSNFLIEKIKKEIEDLEIDLNFQHNNDSISPIKKSKKIQKILTKISNKKQNLDLYFNYILESNKEENGTSNK